MGLADWVIQKQTLEVVLLETAEAWEQGGCTGEEVRESIGAVDGAFLERMLLICMDLPTGYLLLKCPPGGTPPSTPLLP